VRQAPLPAAPGTPIISPSISALYTQATRLDDLAFDLRATGQRDRAAWANVEANRLRSEARRLERKLQPYALSERGLPLAFHRDSRLRLAALGLVTVAAVLLFIIVGGVA